MTTIERPREAIRTTPAPEGRGARRMALMALVAVLSLVVGGVVGYVVRGDATPETPAIVLAGDGELTARQEQMYDLVREAEAAWQAGDADAVVALFTPNGTFETFGTVYRMDDGTFADFLERGTWTSLDVYEPMLVRGNELFSFHSFGGRTYSETMTFTSTGELLITSHVIHS